jgi:hypothetical protein
MLVIFPAKLALKSKSRKESSHENRPATKENNILKLWDTHQFKPIKYFPSILKRIFCHFL